MRLRILTGVAAIAVSCALYPTEAQAQLLGTCPALTPPPCIITDAQKIAGTVSEIREKKQQLETAIQQVKEYASLNGALGRVGAMPQELRSSITPSNEAFRPLTLAPHVTISDTANQLDAVLSSYPNTNEGVSQAERERRLRLRAAAGEGFAIANVTKYKLCRMNKEARRITAQMQSVSSSSSSDMRGDWGINQGAKRLLLDSMVAMREVQAYRLQLMSLESVNAQSTGSGSTQRVEATPPEPSRSPGYALDIGKLANAANQLAALLAARDVIKSITDGIQGSRETQAEYRQIKAVADATQRQVEAVAASDARKKGVSAASLLAIANQYMQTYDRTTWDNPNKDRIAKDAAKRVEKELDRRVRGDVNDSWSNHLTRRAEAFKQEAFFRPIAEDAAAMEKQAIEALAEYEASLGVKASDQSQLNAAIAAAQAEVSQLSSKLGEAPADIVSIRNQILNSTGVNPGQQQSAQPTQVTAAERTALYAAL